MPPPPSREPAPAEIAGDVAPDESVAIDEPETSVVEAATVEVSPPVEEAPPRRIEPQPGQVSVTLQFDGDCWTEITDAAGDRLFFGLGATGRTVDIAGAPPLSVLFGNADNVRVRVDGLDYPIPAASRRGRTARFSIQAP